MRGPRAGRRGLPERGSFPDGRGRIRGPGSLRAAAKLAYTHRRAPPAAPPAPPAPLAAAPAQARTVGAKPVRQQVDVSGHAALRVTAKAKRCAATLTVSVGRRRAASGRVTRHRRTLTAAR